MIHNAIAMLLIPSPRSLLEMLTMFNIVVSWLDALPSAADRCLAAGGSSGKSQVGTSCRLASREN